MHSKLVKTGFAALLVASLAACGSAPKPKAEMALSKAALNSAEQAGAREHAPVSLRKARDKHAAAQAAYAKDSMTTAKRMAQQALVDAEVAQAKANAQKSLVALQELREGIDVMRTEINRVQDN